MVYRCFSHFDAEITPDFTVFSRSLALLSPAVTQEIHQRVVSLACEHGVARYLRRAYAQVRPDIIGIIAILLSLLIRYGFGVTKPPRGQR